MSAPRGKANVPVYNTQYPPNHGALPPQHDNSGGVSYNHVPISPSPAATVGISQPFAATAGTTQLLRTYNNAPAPAHSVVTTLPQTLQTPPQGPPPSNTPPIITDSKLYPMSMQQTVGHEFHTFRAAQYIPTPNARNAQMQHTPTNRFPPGQLYHSRVPRIPGASSLVVFPQFTGYHHTTVQPPPPYSIQSCAAWNICERSGFSPVSQQLQNAPYTMTGSYQPGGPRQSNYALPQSVPPSQHNAPLQPSQIINSQATTALTGGGTTLLDSSQQQQLGGNRGKPLRSHAIPIIDPNSLQEIIVDESKDKNTAEPLPSEHHLNIPSGVAQDVECISHKPPDLPSPPTPPPPHLTTSSYEKENASMVNGPEHLQHRLQNEWQDYDSNNININNTSKVSNNNTILPRSNGAAIPVSEITRTFDSDTLSVDAAVFHSRTHRDYTEGVKVAQQSELIQSSNSENDDLIPITGAQTSSTTSILCVHNTEVDNVTSNINVDISDSKQRGNQSDTKTDSHVQNTLSDIDVTLPPKVIVEESQASAIQLPVVSQHSTVPSITLPQSVTSEVLSQPALSGISSQPTLSGISSQPAQHKPDVKQQSLPSNKQQHPLNDKSSVIMDGNSTSFKSFSTPRIQPADKTNTNAPSTRDEKLSVPKGKKQGNTAANNENIPINIIERQPAKNKTSHFSNHTRNVDSRNQTAQSNIQLKQTNGETSSFDTIPPTSEGKKKKKSGKKDVNKKGLDKEGSDMDAIIVDKTSHTEKEKSHSSEKQQNVTSSTTGGQRISNNTNQTSKTNSSQKNLNKNKYDDEKPMAVKNEESLRKDDNVKGQDVSKHTDSRKSEMHNSTDNKRINPKVNKEVESKEVPKDSKTSANNIPTEKLNAQIDTKLKTDNKTIAIQQPQGPRRYTLDMLHKLNDPSLSTQEVSLPPLLQHIGKNVHNQRPSVSRSHSQSSSGFSNTFMPPFTATSSMTGYPQVSSRRSQQGMSKQQRDKPAVVHVLSIAKDDVQLHTTKDAWKPDRLNTNVKDISPEEKRTAELYKAVTSILNKLTPEKFAKLVGKIKNLPIDTLARLEGVIELIFEKAIDEPGFCRAYAEMCFVVQQNMTTEFYDSKGSKLNFRVMLITKCQTQFERNSAQELNVAKHQKEMNECADPEKKKELQLIFEDEERKVRRRSVGNCRFIGELFKLNLLTAKIMLRCIQQLVSHIEEESLECLCKLLSTIGKDLEQKLGKNDLDMYFKKMQELSEKKSSKISSRIRFMLQDVIDLRRNNWIPRRDENNPKTIEQINEEIAQKEMESKLFLSIAPKKSQQDDRFRDRDNRKGNRMGGSRSNDEGWQVVPQKSGYQKQPSYTLDSKKFQNLAETASNQVSLGCAQNFSKWTRGASSNKTKDTGMDRGRFSGGGSMYSNFDRPPPPIHANANSQNVSNRVTPSSSMDRNLYYSGSREGADAERLRNAYVQNAQPPPPRETASLKQPARQVHDPVTPVPALSPEVIERKSRNILDEYVGNNNLEESISCTKETFDKTNAGNKFVMTLLEYVLLEKNETYREKCGLLFAALIQTDFISPVHIVDAFAELLSISQDMLIDCPNFWLYLSSVIAPVLHDGSFTFEDLRKAADTIYRTEPCEEYLGAILNKVKQIEGPSWVQEKWQNSNLKLENFIDPSRIGVFVKKHSLEYLIGGESIGRDLNSQIFNCLDNEEKLFSIANKYLNEDVHKSPSPSSISFIQALTTAIVEASYVNQFFDLQVFGKYQGYIRKFTNNAEVLELQSLCAVHVLMKKFEYPQGLILTIFEKLWDDEIISTEGFLKWKENENLDGKGVAMKLLHSFYDYLESSVSR